MTAVQAQAQIQRKENLMFWRRETGDLPTSHSRHCMVSTWTLGDEVQKRLQSQLIAKDADRNNVTGIFEMTTLSMEKLGWLCLLKTIKTGFYAHEIILSFKEQEWNRLNGINQNFPIEINRSKHFKAWRREQWKTTEKNRHGIVSHREYLAASHTTRGRM